MKFVWHVERKKKMATTLLKWAGGKRWIVPVLSPILDEFNDLVLVELFAGGAALSFASERKEAILNDKNPHLINFYSQIQRGINIFSTGVSFKNDKETFYKNRKDFNDLIKNGKENTPEAAALFYYLNKTAYNGLVRFNNKGFFNTPFGKYKRINYEFDISSYRDMVRNWNFMCKDFSEVDIPTNALIYADPPYDVEFTAYNAGGFDWKDQVRLVEFLCELSNPIVLSNQATERIVKLYKSHGFLVTFKDAPRSISCKGNREKVKEVIAYRNIPFIQHLINK